MRRISRFAAVLIAASAPALAHAAAFRVCADPNNLPFSNRAGQGFEDAIARLAARDFKENLQYTYALENERFLKHTLNANACDVVMGLPAGMDKVETTQPYYTSSYVFVSRKTERLNLASFTDPRLRSLRIAVHLIGDESTPPVLALGREGIVANVDGFVIDSDFDRPNPAARPVLAVETGRADVAAVWGPFGGYFAKRSPVPLALSPVRDGSRFAPLRFSFAIAMGVRRGEDRLRERLDGFIAAERPAIRRILEAYGVPLENVRRSDD